MWIFYFRIRRGGSPSSRAVEVSAQLERYAFLVFSNRVSKFRDFQIPVEI